MFCLARTLTGHIIPSESTQGLLSHCISHILFKNRWLQTAIMACDFEENSEVQIFGCAPSYSRKITRGKSSYLSVSSSLNQVNCPQSVILFLLVKCKHKVNVHDVGTKWKLSLPEVNKHLSCPASFPLHS